MKKLLFVLAIGLAFSTTAMAVDIAISTKSGWWGQGAADQEMQDIVKNVKGASVQLFTVTDLAALANWVRAHTGDGVPDLLIMCGNFPDTIYPAGNAQPNGSLAELFLDDGNTIINTGDYIFYVGTAANNDAGGLQNMMDLPAVDMWGDAALPCVPTAEGKQFTPSLQTIPSTRPFFFAQLTGDWYPELILAQSADGTRGDPVIVRNRATGGRIGIFYQVADVLTDLRGEVISEWINNWYLPKTAAPKLSSNPLPASGAVDVPRDAGLAWKPGQFAATHDVYFGTVFADVNTATRTNAKGVLAGQGQTASTYDPAGVFAYGQTYYWRIDEVNKPSDNTIFKGDVWSFTTEPYSYPVTGIIATASSFEKATTVPANTINGSGLTGDLHGVTTTTMWNTAMTAAGPAWIEYQFPSAYKLSELWVWNYNGEFEPVLGYGFKDVTIEYSLDGQTWTLLKEAQFAQATVVAGYAHNTTVDMGGVVAQYVKLTAKSNWSMVGIKQYGLSEVRFFYVPVQARIPQPATAAKGVSVDTALAWRPGREAASHKVFFGTDATAVTNGTALAQSVTSPSYSPGSLNLGATYYWKVDEVNAITYPGDVWSFTTQEFKVVDDFERYTDKAGAEIFSTWIDGFADQSSGSTVGLLNAISGTFGETTIFHGGRQSMPLAYDNAATPFYSEATWTFDTPQDWTANGIKSLSLWFQGVAGNGGQLYVKINSTKLLYDGDAADLARVVWQPWNIDLSKAGNVNSVRSLTIGIEGAGAKGTLYIDDICLYPKVPEYVVPVQPAATGLVAYYMLDEGSGTTVKDSSGVGNNGTFGGAAKWVTGYKGGALQLNGSSDYVVIDAVAKSMPANNNFTISAWIKTQGTSGYVVAANDSSGGHAFWMGPAPNGNLQVQADVTHNYPPKINDNQWHMITYVRDGTTAYVYTDGVLVGTETPTANPAGQTLWSIGMEWDPPSASDFYSGLVDEVRFYARPLSAAEVAGLAGLTKTMPKPF